MHAPVCAQDANPGRGLPVLSPEEAALMRSGVAELSRLRRMGAKATKHPPLEKEVGPVSGGGVECVVWCRLGVLGE